MGFRVFESSVVGMRATPEVIFYENFRYTLMMTVTGYNLGDFLLEGVGLVCSGTFVDVGAHSCQQDSGCSQLKLCPRPLL